MSTADGISGFARSGSESSRRLLISTVRALGSQADAATLVGAHAVHFWANRRWQGLPMQATRDADLVLDPEFVTHEPSIIDSLSGIGLEPAREDRPGIYGYPSEANLPWRRRTTVDLIVPEALAGAGRRAARVPGHAKAMSRARGLELAVIDRHEMEVPTLDGPSDAVTMHVAGPAALLIAKAHKVAERVADVARRPERLRPKDSGDVALLMMASDGAACARVMAEARARDVRVSEPVETGCRYLLDLYSSDAPKSHRQGAGEVLVAWDESELYAAIDEWLEAFSAEASRSRLI